MNKSMKDTITALQKKYGNESIASYKDIGNGKDIKRFPTGSYLLDQMLGGGWPVGRVIELLGWESSGKTTLCLHAVAEIQKRGGTVVFIDMEHAVDPTWASKIGVNMEDPNFFLATPNCAEDALGMAVTLAETPGCDLVVIDSIAALVPRAELEGQVGDAHMAVLARLMGQTMRKIAGVAAKNGTTLIFTNQVREKIGVMYGDPTTTPGGNAMKFAASVRIRCTRSTHIQEGGDTVGNVAKVYVMKNKTAPPFQTAELQIYYTGGINREAELAQVYLDLGLIAKSGGWYTLPTSNDLANVIKGTYPYNLKKIISDHEAERLKVQGFEEVVKSV